MLSIMLKLQVIIIILLICQSADCFSSDFTKSIQGRLEFNDYDKAFQIVTQHKQTATRNKDTLKLISALNAQGLIYKHMNKHDIARTYFKDAALLSRTIAYAKGEYSCFMNLGNSYELDGKYDPAIESLTFAYQKAEAMGDSICMAKAKMAIGNVNFAIDDYEQADRNYIEAYTLSVGDTSFVVKLFINTAVNAIEMQSFQKAHNLLQTADECCTLLQDKIDIKLAQGELALKRNDDTNADKYFNEAVRLSVMTNDLRRQGYGFYGLGRLKLTKDFRISENHLKNAYRAFETVNGTIDMVKANNALFELFMHHKKYTDAGAIMKNMGLLVCRPNEAEPGIVNLLNRAADQHETKIKLENALTEEKLKSQSIAMLGLFVFILVVFASGCIFIHYRRITHQTLSEASTACESRRLIKKDLEYNHSLQNMVKAKAIEINAYSDFNNGEHLSKIKQNAIDIIEILDKVNGN